MIYDSVRNSGNLVPDNTSGDILASATSHGGISAISNSSFSVANGSTDGLNVNATSHNYVAWNWKKGITPGFDIVNYTGNGANRVIPHSLGSAPKMMIIKARNLPNSIARNWIVWHTGLSSTEMLSLNLPDAKTTGLTTYWNSTIPTSTGFSLGTENNVNNATGTIGEYIAYLWSEVPGFSKFGSYTGNGSNDGPFVYTGFRPRWILIKSSSAAVSGWVIYDTIRKTYNETRTTLYANTSDIESNLNLKLDILANGFKFYEGGGQGNDSGVTYIYAAFAEAPFKYANAR